MAHQWQSSSHTSLHRLLAFTQNYMNFFLNKDETTKIAWVTGGIQKNGRRRKQRNIEKKNGIEFKVLGERGGIPTWHSCMTNCNIVHEPPPPREKTVF